MKVEVTEKSPKISNNVFAWSLNEIAEHSLVKKSSPQAGKFSSTTCDHPSAIHILVLIKNLLHLANKVHRTNVAAFGHQVEKNPEKRFQVIRDLMWPTRRITQTCYRYELPCPLNALSFSSPRPQVKRSYRA
jgi:hypothetical protein